MQKTNDYDLFKKIEGNRKINHFHLSSLIDSINKNNQLDMHPIVVNEKFEIIDGQHRLEAAKSLGLDIYYIQKNGLNIMDVALMNSNTKNWDLNDFLNLHANTLKNEQYIKLVSWMKKNELGLTQAIAFFIDEANILDFRNNFKQGRYEFNDKMLHYTDMYKLLINKIMVANPGPSRIWKNQGFIRAFLIFFQNPEIDEKRFWDQYHKYTFLVCPQPSKQRYLEMFTELYNYRRHIRIENP